jgi:hypothetical protein
MSCGRAFASDAIWRNGRAGEESARWPIVPGERERQRGLHESRSSPDRTAFASIAHAREATP